MVVKTPRKAAFVADAMLGKLARWLRLLGVKVFFIQTTDDETIRKAMKENAVLLTRDESLAAKAKSYCKAILFKTDDQLEQLKIIMKKFNLKPGRNSFSLCPKCGGKIKRISKTKVENAVYPRVYKQQRRFWKCGDCGKIYWKGSHFKEITAKLKELKNNGRKRVNEQTERLPPSGKRSGKTIARHSVDHAGIIVSGNEGRPAPDL